MWSSVIVTIFNLLSSTSSTESNEPYEYWKPRASKSDNFINFQDHVAQERSLNTHEDYNHVYRYPQYDNGNNYLDYGDYLGDGQINYDKVTNLVSNGLKRFSGHPLANDIDRQIFGVPIPVIFALALSVVAFGGVAGQAGLFDAISDILNPTSAPAPAPAPLVTSAPSTPNLCPASRVQSCRANEGSDGCDPSNGQCRCGTSTACSGSMPICRNPNTPFAFCACNPGGNGAPSSCSEPNPTCGTDGICACVNNDATLPAVVCPKEFSNICVPGGTNVMNPTSNTNGICGCANSGTFCSDGTVCKQDTSGVFGCRDCTPGDCPAYAPLCGGTPTRCTCGAAAASTINTMIHNTCTTEDASGVFSCGKPGKGTGAPCVATSLNPRCFNDLINTPHGMIILGDETSTCKCSSSADCDKDPITNDPSNQKKNTVCKTVPTDAAKTDLGKCILCEITTLKPAPQGTCPDQKVCNTQDGTCLTCIVGTNQGTSESPNIGCTPANPVCKLVGGSLTCICDATNDNKCTTGANKCNIGTGACSCGSTNNACTAGTTTPNCLLPNGNAPTTPTDDADQATCQCSGMGSTDTCLTAGSAIATAPLCGTTANVGAQTGQCTVCTNTIGQVVMGDGTMKGSCTDASTRCKQSGECKCQAVDGTDGDGDGTAKGTCTDASKRCKQNGECKCQKVDGTDGDGDGTAKGTCTDPDKRCKSDGECKCQAVDGTDGDGDGTAQGTCTDASKRCKQSGECKCQAVAGTDGDGDGMGQGTCANGMVCCMNGNCEASSSDC